MAAPDLITQPYLASILDVGGLTAVQVGALPALTSAASRAVRTYTNRYFSRRPAIDELYTVKGNRRRIVLREYPVNAVSRASSDPTAVLTLGVLDATTNQRATVALTTTGDVDSGLIVTGLTLTRWASGVAVVAAVPFAGNPTVAGVAAAIRAVGGSWEALAAPGYELWASGDLRAVQGAQPAIGADAAALFIHATDLPFSLDERSGVLALDTPTADPFASARWGPYGGDDDARDRSYGRGFLIVRVVYDAGFDVVPFDVQYLTALAVKSLAEQSITDSTILEEHGGVDGYTTRAMVGFLPDAVKAGLEPWRNVRG